MGIRSVQPLNFVRGEGKYIAENRQNRAAKEEALLIDVAARDRAKSCPINVSCTQSRVDWQRGAPRFLCLNFGNSGYSCNTKIPKPKWVKFGTKTIRQGHVYHRVDDTSMSYCPSKYIAKLASVSPENGAVMKIQSYLYILGGNCRRSLLMKTRVLLHVFLFEMRQLFDVW